MDAYIEAITQDIQAGGKIVQAMDGVKQVLFAGS